MHAELLSGAGTAAGSNAGQHGSRLGLPNATNAGIPVRSGLPPLGIDNEANANGVPASTRLGVSRPIPGHHHLGRRRLRTNPSVNSPAEAMERGLAARKVAFGMDEHGPA
jgi:hypothetical protein